MNGRIAMLLAVLALGCGACIERHDANVAWRAVPAELQLEGLDGTVTALNAYAGRIVVLNFWATWCAPCRAEMDSLERLSRSVDPRLITVIGVSVDEDINLVREHVLRNGWTFARFIDRRQAIAHSGLGIDALPRSYVIAADGSTVAVITGPREWTSAQMREVLRRATAGAGRPADTAQPSS